MDVSAQTLREVEFREKLRGYHPDDVDEFLERVAAGIDYLQDRLRQATERAQRAEARASESVDGDDALKRTLVLAQRTAELAVSEARQEAERIASSARTEAQAIVSQAEELARRAIEDTQGGIRAELEQLEAARDQLHTDIVGLERHLEQERGRLRASLADALQAVDEHLSPLAPAPAVADVDVPPRRVPKVGPLPELDREALAAFAPALPREPEPAAEPEPESVGHSAGEPEPLEELLEIAASEFMPSAANPDPPASDVDDLEPFTAIFSTRPESKPETKPESRPEPVRKPEPIHAPAMAQGRAVPEVEPDPQPEIEVASPMAEAVPSGEDDPFIAELRRAITDTQPLGPREEGEAAEGTSGGGEGGDLMHGDVLDGSRLGSLLRRRR